jgi:hypothetical protein
MSERGGEAAARGAATEPAERPESRVPSAHAALRQGLSVARAMSRQDPASPTRASLAAAARAALQRTGSEAAPPSEDSRRQLAALLALQRSPQHEAMSARFAAEERDSTGSRQLADHFTQALNDLDLDGVIDELACAKTLCRVNLHFSDIGHALRFQQEAGMPELRKSMDLQLVDDQLDVEVFLARD